MADLTVSISLHDGSESLTNITLSRANGYKIMALKRGARTPDRGPAESPWANGDVSTLRRFPRMHGALTIRATDTSYHAARTKLLAVRAFVEQNAYQITVTIADDTEVWKCVAAASAEGSEDGQFDQIDALKATPTLYVTDIPYLT